MLNRLAITGEVSTNTPKVVIEEIADAHFIKYKEDLLADKKYLINLLLVINTRSVKKVQRPFSKKNYSTIARYVNSKCFQWKKDSLEKAFEFILQYTNIEKLLEKHIDFEYGLQTPDKITSLNACVLYGICKANNIITSFYTTLDDMAYNIKLLFSMRNPEIQHSIKSYIYNSLAYGECDSYQLVNLAYLINPDNRINKIEKYSETQSYEILNSYDNSQDEKYNIREYTYEELESKTDEIREREIKIKPKNNLEAIVMAALYYKIDLTQVKNPLVEYLELSRIPYFPYDQKLATRLKIAFKYPENLANPYLNKIFNPNLPFNMYEKEDLEQLCEAEGLVIGYRESPYTMLQTIYLSETFVHGKQGYIINEENTFLEEIEELEYDDVVIFGVRNSEVTAYTYGELYDTFRSYMRFRKPNINEIFSETAINKLFLLTQIDQRSTESSEAFDLRIQLGEEIERIRLFSQANQEQIQIFYNKYTELEEMDRRRVENLLTYFLHTGMFMRGWKGEEYNYPLKSYETNFEPDEQIHVDFRVTKSLIVLENKFSEINDLDGLGTYIKNLPLIIYDVYSNNFHESGDESEGLTIVDRIDIIRSGENGITQSCIRMSSNRIVSTAYFYMRLIGMSLPFNISDVANIT